MNIAIVFAGGTGTRMNSRTKPKQFLELHGKAVIIYTLEVFDNSKNIDEIIVVCLEDWIPYLQDLVKKTPIKKLRCIVPGGETVQESQYLGLQALSQKLNPSGNDIVLIHDGVRPLVDEETIDKNILSVKQYGSAITVVPAIETIITVEDGFINNVYNRSKCRMGRAPQSFFYKDIIKTHQKAIQEGKHDFIDSASMFMYYGYNLHVVEGNVENIKITTPLDFYTFRALCDARENFQIFG